MSDPTGTVTFQLTRLNDGTGYGTDDACALTSANGYTGIVDDGPLDGVMCIWDSYQYQLSWNVKEHSSPVTVQISLPEVVPTSNFDLSWCTGGSGYNHTGTWSNNGCSLTFPAGPSYTSQVVLGSVTPRFTGVISPYVELNLDATLRADDGPIQVIGSLRNDFALVTTAGSTASMTPDYTIERRDGVAGARYTVNLATAPMKFPAGYSQTKGAGGVRAHVEADVSFDQWPASTQLSGTGVSQSGLTAHTSSDCASSVGAAQNAAIIYKVDTKCPAITVWVPIADIPQGSVNVFTAHIVSVDATVLDTGEPNLSGADEPGEGEPESYSTADSVTGTVDGILGHLNNDWVDTKVDTSIDKVPISKDLVVDDGGTPGARVWKVRPNQKYWARLKIMPALVNSSSLSVCDLWDSTGPDDVGHGLSFIDTTLDPVVLWADPDAGEMKPVPGDVEYADRGSDDYPEVPSCTSSRVSWSAAPAALTDSVRVDIPSADLAASARYTVPGEAPTKLAGVVFIPMRAGDLDSYPQYPDSSYYARDMFTISIDSGPYRTHGASASVEIAGPTGDTFTNVYPVPSGIAAGSTAGTQASISGTLSLTVPPDATFGDIVESTPYMTIDVGPCASDLESIPRDDWTYEVTHAPDPGADGILCTPDDTDHWSLKATRTSPVDIISTYTMDRTEGPAISFKALPWAPDGSKIGVEPKLYFPGADWLFVHGGSESIAVSNGQTVGQYLTRQTADAGIGDTLGWDMYWFNLTDDAAGDGSFIFVLPYDGDVRGSALATALSDVTFSTSSGAAIQVSTDPPGSITQDSDATGTTWCVPSDAACIGGREVTAVRVTPTSIAAHEVGAVHIGASSDGTHGGDTAVAGLGTAHVTGFALTIPPSANMTTTLHASAVNGTAWLDNNHDGVRQEDEEPLADVDVELLQGGQAIATATTDQDGTYSFENVTPGSYEVQFGLSGLPEAPSGSYHFTVQSAQSAPDDTGLTPPFVAVRDTVVTQDAGVFLGIGSVSIVKTAPWVNLTLDTLTNGMSVTWRYVVTNTGTIPLTNLVVTDDRGVAVNCPTDTLDAGDSMPCFGVGALLPTS